MLVFDCSVAAVAASAGLIMAWVSTQVDLTKSLVDLPQALAKKSR